MKKGNILKKALSLSMAFLMIFSSFPNMLGNFAFAEDVPQNGDGIVTMPGYAPDGADVKDYPGTESQGHVRMSKSARWVDLEAGIAEVSFKLSGTPIRQGVDAILVIDRSGSMGTGDYKIDEICVNPEHSYRVHSNSRMLTWSDSGNSWREENFWKTEETEYQRKIAICPDCGKTYNFTSSRKRTGAFGSYGSWSSWTVPTPTLCNVETVHLNKAGNIITQHSSNGCSIVNSRLGVAQQAAKNFIGTMFKDEGDTPESKNRVGLVSFGASATKEVGLSYSSSAGTLESKIDKLKADGGTNYDNALQEVINMLEARNKIQAEKDRPVYVIFLTDGKPDPSQYTGKTQADTLKKSIANKGYNATIYSLGFMMNSSYYDNLKNIASSPSDKYFYPVTDPRTLGSTFTSIANNTKIAGTNAILKDFVNTANFNGTITNVVASYGTSVAHNADGKIDWTIGDITAEEKTLTFKIKLRDDKMTSVGLLETNQGPAILQYTNFRDNACEKKAAPPELPRNACSIDVHYYLVNENGEPISSTEGVTDAVPWGEKHPLNDFKFEYEGSSSLLPNIKYSVEAQNIFEKDGVKYEYVLTSAGKGGNPTLSGSPVDVTMSGYGQSIEVYFGYKRLEKVTVNYDSNHEDVSDYVDANPGSQVINKYSNVGTLPTEPTRQGYTFVAWNTAADGKGNVFESNTPVLSSITVYAQWKASEGIEYKVEHHLQNLDDDDYTLDTSATEIKTGTTGEDTQAQAKTTYTGFTPKAFTQEKVSANGETVVRIYYDRNKYTVTYKPGESGNFIEDKHENVKYGSNRPEFRGVIEGKPGYQFNGWNIDPSLDIKVTKDLVYEAQWVEGNEITIQYIAKTDGVVSEIGGIVSNSLENLSPATGIAQGSIAYAKEGYTFVNWTNSDGDIIYTTDSKYIPDKVGNLNVPGTYYANFAKDDSKWHTVKFETDGNGTLTGTTEFKDILDGTEWSSEITVPSAAPSEGYSFKEWSPALPADPTDKIISDRVYTAIFEKNTYTITYKIVGDYFIDDNFFNDEYKYGEAITKLAQNMDKAGYTFSGWSTIPDNMPAEHLTITGYYETSYDTKYTVEHYQQNLAGDGYAIFETENDLKGTTGVDAYAAAKHYEGFTENATHSDRVPSGTILADGSLVLKLFYDRNKYTVTYAPGTNGTFDAERT